MKEYEKETIEKTILAKVTCDLCNEECTKKFADIDAKLSFMGKPQAVETICYACFEKIYLKKVLIKNKELQQQRAKERHEKRQQ